VRSSFDILAALYAILDVPELPPVTIGNGSLKQQGEFITIGLINNPNKYLQNGYGNVNIYVPELSEGRYNTFRLKQLTDIIIPILEDVTNGNYYFQIDDDKGMFTDPDRDLMTYYNIKIQYQTL